MLKRMNNTNEVDSMKLKQQARNEAVILDSIGKIILIDLMRAPRGKEIVVVTDYARASE